MDKNFVIKKNPDCDVSLLVDKKIDFFKDIIQKTVLHVYKNKILDILGINDVNACIEKLTQLSKKINELPINKHSQESLINELQIINNELSSLFKNYGTENLEDMILICFGNNNNKISTNSVEDTKVELLKKYFHPTGYKVVTVSKKDDKKKNDENDNNIGCSDVSTTYKQLHMKVYGIKVCINNNNLNKSIIVFGIVDDVIIDFLNNSYILSKQKMITQNLPEEIAVNKEAFEFFVSSLTLKDYLIYDTSTDYYTKFMGYLNQNNIIHQKPISIAVKEFISDEIFNKRNTLIQLLIKSSHVENQYFAYLLYDLLSNDTNGSIDSQEQIIIFDSFPWPVKQQFKQAMKKTVQYTNDLSNFDMNKIPLEQQICLLKATDNVKEKAMMKLKELKSKSEDSGSKARQYLDGLLKIPFGIYTKEPILNIMDENRTKFKNIYNSFSIGKTFPEIPNKENYTSVEVLKYIKKIGGPNIESSKIDSLNKQMTSGDKKELIKNISVINDIFKKYNKKEHIKCQSSTKHELKEEINKFFVSCKLPENEKMLEELNNMGIIKNEVNINNKVNTIDTEIASLNRNMTLVNEYMKDVKLTLDKAVYGHDKAKKQIERIIGQWINGEQDGYCFGFEGPPGVGKTSLAKRGLSDCLKDNNGASRPFSMIQMGGDSNGSTLHGHNYTYVGSTWGSIVQILIDKKCMNPIIFIDEVDKISKTEHGKEIVGILTHLLDPAQNDCFQDKYFTGIDIDLSKALFILSYNDAEAIDKILLDRVHRIKFSNLTLDDKLIISKSHILPEVYKKMGLENMLSFSDDVLKFIIDEYTSESGVRKLKEILFEIVGEVNLDILKNTSIDIELPIIITKEDIKTRYFKDKHEIKHKKIHLEHKIGIINGLWANALGKGGVIPIQVNWLPSDKFLSLKLTGMQGDVMKESMNVALTLAWKLTPVSRQKLLRDEYCDVTNLNGVHIHCPEGSVPKDGPSAGTAITTAIFSIFNNKKIKYHIAITGEISLDGNVTEIGGLDLKFIGGIKAGVKDFIFPNENLKDYTAFIDKYKGSDILDGIHFYPVDTIDDVLKLVFENEE